MSPRIAKPQRFDIRENRYRVAAWLGALAGLNLVLYLALNLPRIHREAVVGERVTAVTQGLGELSRRVGLMKAVDGQCETERVKVETLYKDILGAKDDRMIQIQREVRSIAASFGMDPETVQYQPDFLDKVGLVRFQINVPLVGDYRNLRQFINKVEQSKHFLIIDGVALGGSKDGGALLDLNIQLSTYFNAPEAKMREPDRPTPAGKT